MILRVGKKLRFQLCLKFHSISLVTSQSVLTLYIDGQFLDDAFDKKPNKEK